MTTSTFTTLFPPPLPAYEERFSCAVREAQSGPRGVYTVLAVATRHQVLYAELSEAVQQEMPRRTWRKPRRSWGE